jgi:hypothetical protein
VLFAAGLLAATVPVIALIVVKCAAWPNLNLFWLDCAATGDVGPAMAAAANRPGRRLALAGR